MRFWALGVLGGAGRQDRLVGGGLVGFSFPIKFGWCSVWGKNEKLILGWSWVRVGGGRKIGQKEGISGEKIGGRRLTGVAVAGGGATPIKGDYAS